MLIKLNVNLSNFVELRLFINTDNNLFEHHNICRIFTFFFEALNKDYLKICRDFSRIDSNNKSMA